MGKGIDRKIIIGSTITIVLIILASIIPVIGVQTLKIDSSEASPLFNIRTQRATDTESQQTFRSNYIGKDRNIDIPLTFQTRATVVHNIIKRINEMDDASFEKFLAHITKEIDYAKNVPLEILKAIYIIREESDRSIPQENADLDTLICETLQCQTAYRCSTIFGGCITYKFFTGLIRMLDKIYVYTEKIPLLTGTITLLLHQILVILYEMYTTTLPSPG